MLKHPLTPSAPQHASSSSLRGSSGISVSNVSIGGGANVLSQSGSSPNIPMGDMYITPLTRLSDPYL